MLFNIPNQGAIYYKTRLSDKYYLKVIDLHESNINEFLRFLRSLSPTSLFQRFNHCIAWDLQSLNAFFTDALKADLSLIAVLDNDRQTEIIGYVELVSSNAPFKVEYSIVIRDDWQNQGIGSLLTKIALELAKQIGVKQIFAITSLTNNGMKQIFKRFNFKFLYDFNENQIYVEKSL